MKSATMFAFATAIGSVVGYPGMKATFEDISYIGKRDLNRHLLNRNTLIKRQNTTATDANTGQAVDPKNATGLTAGSLSAAIPNTELIGDLLTVGV